MSRDVEAGRAFVRVSVKENMEGLKAVSGKLKAWGAGIASVGAGMVGAGATVLAPLAAMVKGFSDAGSAVADMSARTGVSAEKLSALGYAASMTGASIEDVERGIRTMQKNGIGADKIGAVADKLAAMTNPAERTAYAMSIFGKGATALIPMLSGGSKGLADFTAEAERLGLVISSEDAAAADALGDSMDNVKGSLKGVSMQIGAALAPIVTDLATRLSDIVARVVAFMKANRPLIVTIAKVAVGVMAVGGVLTAIGAIVASAGVAVGGLVTVMSALGAVLGVVMSPIGLLVATIAAGTAAFVTFTDTGRWLAETLMGDFGTAFGTVKDTIQGVLDALSGGDFALAGQIAMTGIKLAFFEATKSIRSLWIDMNKVLVDSLMAASKMMVGIAQNIADKFNEAWGGIQIFLRDGIQTNNDAKNVAAHQEMQALKAKKSTMDPAEFDKQYRALAARTGDIFQNDATKNSGIYAARDATSAAIDSMAGKATSALDAFNQSMQETMSADQAAGDERLAALRAQLATEKDKAKAVALGAKTDAPKPTEIKAATEAAMAATPGMTGTFSAAAAAIGFNGPRDDAAKLTAENTKESVRVLKRIEHGQQNSGLLFT